MCVCKCVGVGVCSSFFHVICCVCVCVGVFSSFLFFFM